MIRKTFQNFYLFIKFFAHFLLILFLHFTLHFSLSISEYMLLLFGDAYAAWFNASDPLAYSADDGQYR